MEKGEPTKIPVAIVGGGPVGLLLALFLDRYGVRSVIFNSDAEVRPHPKGSSHNSRTMEHHRTLGIAKQIRSFSLPPNRPTDVSYFTRLTGWELARLRMPPEEEKQRAVAASAITDQVPEPILRANQMYVEAFLLAHVRTRKNITVRFGWCVDRFDDDDNGVTISSEAIADNAQKGSREEWRAQYMVGCDGGRSFVRRALALRYHGFAKLDAPHYGGRMIATHLRAPTLYRNHLAHRHGWQYWTVNPDTRATIISLRGDEEFLVFSKAKEDETQPSDADIAQLVQRAVGVDLPLTMLDHRVWTAGIALVAEQFIAGRVVLAGDAAHLFTPTGGFGMNTGMDDASNLSWKLAAILQRWGGEKLLQTYDIERRPVAERNTRAARELNIHLANLSVPDCIESASIEGETARQYVGAQLSTFGEEFASLGVQLGARYDGSPIIVENGAPPAENYSQYIPSSVPGGRMPHFWLDDGRGYGSSIFDQLGIGFTLMRLGGATADIKGIENAARIQKIPLDIIEITSTAVRDLYGCDFVILRPDQYVAWSGNAVPSDPAQLWSLLRGAN